MGYTHYYGFTSKVKAKDWQKIIKDCEKLFNSLPDTTDSAGGYYDSDKLTIGRYDWDVSDEVLPVNAVNAFNEIYDAKTKVLMFTGYPVELAHETLLLAPYTH